MRQDEIDYIKKIVNNGVVNSSHADKLWDIHLNLFQLYPEGEKTCSNCLLDTFDKIYKHMITIQNQPPK